MNIRVHKFVNETDFEASQQDVHAPGEANFKAFINQYISYKYEPCHLELEEARYFTEDFEE